MSTMASSTITKSCGIFTAAMSTKDKRKARKQHEKRGHKKGVRAEKKSTTRASRHIWCPVDSVTASREMATSLPQVQDVKPQDLQQDTAAILLVQQADAGEGHDVAVQTVHASSVELDTTHNDNAAPMIDPEFREKMNVLENIFPDLGNKTSVTVPRGRRNSVIGLNNMAQEIYDTARHDGNYREMSRHLDGEFMEHVDDPWAAMRILDDVERMRVSECSNTMEMHKTDEEIISGFRRLISSDAQAFTDADLNKKLDRFDNREDAMDADSQLPPIKNLVEFDHDCSIKHGDVSPEAAELHVSKRLGVDEESEQSSSSRRLLALLHRGTGSHTVEHLAPTSRGTGKADVLVDSAIVSVNGSALSNTEGRDFLQLAHDLGIVSVKGRITTKTPPSPELAGSAQPGHEPVPAEDKDNSHPASREASPVFTNPYLDGDSPHTQSPDTTPSDSRALSPESGVQEFPSTYSCHTSLPSHHQHQMAYYQGCNGMWGWYPAPNPNMLPPSGPHGWRGNLRFPTYVHGGMMAPAHHILTQQQWYESMRSLIAPQPIC